MTLLIVLLAITLAVGFYMSWNIGANDVANAMGTSVGSKALTFRKAIVLAAVFEFCGAYFVGSHVSQTIRKGIIPIDEFIGAPQAVASRPATAPASRAASGEAPTTALAQISDKEMEFALGMLSALLAAAIWLNVATSWGQPVSTTHAIVGAVLGFGISARGMGAPDWLVVGRISLSWVISPLVGGVIAYGIYKCVQKFVLGARHPVLVAKRIVPLAMGAVICILALSMIHKVLKTDKSTTGLGYWQAVGVSIALGSLVAIMALIAMGIGTRKLRYRRRDQYGLVERWFRRVQVITACFLAFSHGANDVANAIGPLAGAVSVFRGGSIQAQAAVPDWLLVLGGVGIVVGLATYGYKVIEAVGKKITEITPTRGFSAEFATAVTVLVCSRMGLPISTTFVLVGAVMGVGLARGFAAIDLTVVRKIFTSWVVTIPISALLAGLIFQAIKAIVL